MYYIVNFVCVQTSFLKVNVFYNWYNVYMRCFITPDISNISRHSSVTKILYNTTIFLFALFLSSCWISYLIRCQNCLVVECCITIIYIVMLNKMCKSCDGVIQHIKNVIFPVLIWIMPSINVQVVNVDFSLSYIRDNVSSSILMDLIDIWKWNVPLWSGKRYNNL